MLRKTAQHRPDVTQNADTTIDETMNIIRARLAASLSRLTTDQQRSFLAQYAVMAENGREQIESSFVPIWTVYNLICTYGIGLWRDELRDILLFIYKNGKIKGEMTIQDVIHLLQRINHEEIVAAVRTTRPGRIRSFIGKIQKTAEVISQRQRH